MSRQPTVTRCAMNGSSTRCQTEKVGDYLNFVAGTPCLTRVSHRPIVWSHEIPNSGISHDYVGSSPDSDTQAGDISPIFTALEHAAGDITALGTNPPHGGSSPPSDTNLLRIFRPGI